MSKPRGYYRSRRKDGRMSKPRPITGKKGQPYRRPEMKTVELQEKPKGWSITFDYGKGSEETVQVVARDSDDALNQALKVRNSNLKPKRILIVDPTLGQVVSAIGKGAMKLARGTGKGVKKGLYVAGRTYATYGELKREYRIGKVTTLVRDAFSENPARRAVARAQLRERYPEVYRNLGLARV